MASGALADREATLAPRLTPIGTPPIGEVAIPSTLPVPTSGANHEASRVVGQPRQEEVPAAEAPVVPGMETLAKPGATDVAVVRPSVELETTHHLATEAGSSAGSRRSSATIGQATAATAVPSVVVPETTTRSMPRPLRPAATATGAEGSMRLPARIVTELRVNTRRVRAPGRDLS